MYSLFLFFEITLLEKSNFLKLVYFILLFNILIITNFKLNKINYLV